MKHVFLLLLVSSLWYSCARRPVAAPPSAPTTTDISQPPVAVQMPVDTIQTPPPPASDAPYRFLQLERTACYGKCPVYTVDFYSNGLVIYQGKRYTLRPGMHESRIGETEIEELLQRLSRSGYYDFADSYPAAELRFPDMPLTILRATDVRRQRKSVAIQYEAPEALDALLRHVDALIESLTFDWVEG